MNEDRLLIPIEWREFFLPFPLITAKVGLWFIEHLLPQRFHVKVISLMNKFLDGLASLRSPANILMVFVTSVVIWLLETANEESHAVVGAHKQVTATWIVRTRRPIGAA